MIRDHCAIGSHRERRCCARRCRDVLLTAAVGSGLVSGAVGQEHHRMLDPDRLDLNELCYARDDHSFVVFVPSLIACLSSWLQ